MFYRERKCSTQNGNVQEKRPTKKKLSAGNGNILQKTETCYRKRNSSTEHEIALQKTETGYRKQKYSTENGNILQKTGIFLRKRERGVCTPRSFFFLFVNQGEKMLLKWIDSWGMK